jgi:hypothetical protein
MSFVNPDWVMRRLLRGYGVCRELGKATLRLSQRQDGRCPLCEGLLLQADPRPAGTTPGRPPSAARPTRSSPPATHGPAPSTAERHRSSPARRASPNAPDRSRRRRRGTAISPTWSATAPLTARLGARRWSPRAGGSRRRQLRRPRHHRPGPAGRDLHRRPRLTVRGGAAAAVGRRLATHGRDPLSHARPRASCTWHRPSSGLARPGIPQNGNRTLPAAEPSAETGRPLHTDPPSAGTHGSSHMGCTSAALSAASISSTRPTQVSAV